MASPTNDTIPPHQPIRILLVEDNEAHTKLILRAFKEDRLANPIHSVTDGEEALDYLYRRGDYEDPDTSPRPDLVLLDLKLPKIGGQEVLKTIKEDNALRRIPVVILTSSQTRDDLSEAYQHYANSYLNKPLDFDKFHLMVQKLDFYWTIWNRAPVF